jgi:putative ABC transport system permease protein
MGRNFLPDEEKPDSDGVVILSHGFWQRRFGGDRSIIGQTIYLDGRPQSVIAVMPQEFALFLPSETHMATNIDVWWPNAVDYSKMHRLSHGLTVIGRLSPGVTREQAQAEMDGIAAGLYDQFYQSTGFAVKVVSLHSDIVRKIRPALLVLLGAVGFVLLIACANVANLFLARAAGREREIAVRTALGAARYRIIRQLLTESILLSFIGGAFGLLVAAWGMDALLSLAPANLPRVDKVTIDARVLGFTFGLAVLTGIVFGLVPALQVSKPDLNRVLKEGGRSGTLVPSSSIRGTGAPRQPSFMYWITMAFCCPLPLSSSFFSPTACRMFLTAVSSARTPSSKRRPSTSAVARCFFSFSATTLNASYCCSLTP